MQPQIDHQVMTKSKEDGCFGATSGRNSRGARHDRDGRAHREAQGGLRGSGSSQLLARLEPEDGTPKPCPRCGKRIRLKATGRRRRIRTLSKTQTIERNYHYCRECMHGFYPRDIELGLSESGDITYELEKRVLDLAESVHASFSPRAVSIRSSRS